MTYPAGDGRSHRTRALPWGISWIWATIPTIDAAGDATGLSRVELTGQLEALTARVCLYAYRMLLDTPGVTATVPMVRGVWGRALRRVDEDIYNRIFAGEGPPHLRLPRYVMRPAPPDAASAPAMEWFLFVGDVDSDRPASLRAWEIACGMGLGPDRIPFRIRSFVQLGPAQSCSGEEPAPSWPLSMASWPLNGAPRSTPCVLSFKAPLRLTRQGRLLLRPTFADIAVAALRRISALAGCASGEAYRDLVRAVRAEAAWLPATAWRGQRQDLRRWSGAQKREIDLFGVAGGLALPEGPGQLWPLLAAASWTHIGKGTVFGLGQLDIDAFAQAGSGSER